MLNKVKYTCSRGPASVLVRPKHGSLCNIEIGFEEGDIVVNYRYRAWRPEGLIGFESHA